ncbi:MAG: DNA polymerase IV [Gemmatimonadota bacterium]|nr:DNA polymerase IV [Gemmatimonadota bacterium]
MPARRILLADADAFFVAVARMADPEGAGRTPLLIVGGRPGGRGVVCSASYETRAFGVRSAMPIDQALRLCPDALCIPVPRQACSTTSRAIAAVLMRFTPVVEGASIDEWYLDLSGTESLYKGEPFEETAIRVRLEVQRETGMWLSIGGGTSKLVAKLAAERAKPRPDVGGSGVRIIAAGEEEAFLRGLTLAEIPGIGPKLQQRLRGLGLVRVEDVLPHERATLARWLGRRPAEWLWARVRGIHTSPVEARAAARQMSRETTFSKDVRETAALAASLRGLAARVGAELRHDRLGARTVTVKVKDMDFTTRLASRTLPEPLESDRAIAEVAVSLLGKLRSARQVPARLVGVALGNFVPARDAEQLALFGGAPQLERPQDRAVSRAMDRVRERFGSEAIRSGTRGGAAQQRPS